MAPTRSRSRRRRAWSLVSLATTALLTMVPVASADTHNAVAEGEPRIYALLTDRTVELTEPGEEKPLTELLAQARSGPRTDPDPGAGARAVPGAAASTGRDDMAGYECREQAAAFTGQGWGKSRFVTCQAHDLTVAKIECWLLWCRITGTAKVEVADIQRTRNGARQIDVVQVLDNWRLDGDIAAMPLSSEVTCTAGQGFGPCKVRDGHGGPQTQTVGEWAAEGLTSRYFSFTLPEAGGLGQALISYADLAWHFWLPVGGVPGAERADGPNSSVRCDSASYIIKTWAGAGCVFPWVTETLEISATDYPESAAHILRAQHQPEETFPPAPGKKIPGAPGTAPLHRVADENTIDQHRNVSIAACLEWFPNYAHEGLDCDEYPFASTLEGADKSHKNYSVDPIPDTDNRGAGGKMSAFYTGRRILGSDFTHDPFYVDVTAR
ncbi:NucA/NucB deoxyribonuclease domain-containing protein [Streptomyces hydrogenans]|uniref:NucA/NucB deoxyribonuclease domain-containing protein n=1 Tax=Streptomyces hydrogenans TaxID=1873719 RepID=UPI0036C95789